MSDLSLHLLTCRRCGWQAATSDGVCLDCTTEDENERVCTDEDDRWWDEDEEVWS